MTRPRFARVEVHDYLLDAARHLLAERERRYPGLVEAGKLAQAEAVRKLELARCLVAQWTWIADDGRAALPEWREPGHFNACPRALEADLADAAARARVQADAEPTAMRCEIADLYEALAWYQRRRPGDPACFGVMDAEDRRAINAALRAALPPRRLAA